MTEGGSHINFRGRITDNEHRTSYLTCWARPTVKTGDLMNSLPHLLGLSLFYVLFFLSFQVLLGSFGSGGRGRKFQVLTGQQVLLVGDII